MIDRYRVEGQLWDVSDHAEPCVACGQMSFICIYAQAGKICLGCNDGALCVAKATELES
jgi:hypothetical protein